MFDEMTEMGRQNEHRRRDNLRREVAAETGSLKTAIERVPSDLSKAVAPEIEVRRQRQLLALPLAQRFDRAEREARDMMRPPR
jgi:hypothetical protein